jgi:hypothetical protein
VRFEQELTYRNLKVVDASPQEASMDGIEEMVIIDDPDDGANHEDNLGEEFAKIVQFLLEGSLLLILTGLLHGGLDFT